MSIVALFRKHFVSIFTFLLISSPNYQHPCLNPMGIFQILSFSSSQLSLTLMTSFLMKYSHLSSVNILDFFMHIWIHWIAGWQHLLSVSRLAAGEVCRRLGQALPYAGRLLWNSEQPHISALCLWDLDGCLKSHLEVPISEPRLCWDACWGHWVRPREREGAGEEATILSQVNWQKTVFSSQICLRHPQKALPAVITPNVRAWTNLGGEIWIMTLYPV